MTGNLLSIKSRILSDGYNTYKETAITQTSRPKRDLAIQSPVLGSMANLPIPMLGVMLEME